jgi:hypothetical protein
MGRKRKGKCTGCTEMLSHIISETQNNEHARKFSNLIRIHFVLLRLEAS